VKLPETDPARARLLPRRRTHCRSRELLYWTHPRWRNLLLFEAHADDFQNTIHKPCKLSTLKEDVIGHARRLEAKHSELSCPYLQR
jgi:hypothetical protein